MKNKFIIATKREIVQIKVNEVINELKMLKVNLVNDVITKNKLLNEHIFPMITNQLFILMRAVKGKEEQEILRERIHGIQEIWNNMFQLIRDLERYKNVCHSKLHKKLVSELNEKMAFNKAPTVEPVRKREVFIDGKESIISEI